jgi:hypothetical protein
VGRILADPKGYAGREVTVVGYYRGWDLLREVGSPPPITRSDWVIKDTSGAIYVEARGGVESEVKLDPSAKADTEKVLRLTGIVRLTDKDQPYIEPKRIELVK